MRSSRWRARLVEEMQTGGALNRPEVRAAFLAVPRELFLPGADLDQAYTDEPVVIKRDAEDVPISSSSQPSMMAIMLEQLGVRPGLRVLEIGAGTGYNAALLAELVGDRGLVVSVDIDDDLVDGARRSLDAAGYSGVRVVRADGAHGYPADAPYNRIIATVGVPDLLPAWAEQLAPGGRLVVPLDLNGLQRSIAFERDGDHWTSLSIVDCGFMRLRGPFAGTEVTHRLPGDRRLQLGSVHPDHPVDTDAIGRVLDELPTAVESETTATTGDLFRGLGIWLAVVEPRLAVLSEAAKGRGPGITGAGFRVGRTVLAPAVLTGDSIALLSPGDANRLRAHGFGPSGAKLAAALLDHAARWDALGRPAGRDIRIDAYPAGTPVTGGYVVDKPYSRLVISWPSAGI